MKKLCAFFILFSAGMLVACAPNTSPNAYNAAEVGVVSKVKKGQIVGKRPVTVNDNSGIGSLAGATAGAAAGTLAGHNPATVVVGAVGGAVVGGLLGNAADRSLHKQKAYEYIIKLLTGPTISVVQTADMQFAVKQHVLVIFSAKTRIIPDETE